MACTRAPPPRARARRPRPRVRHAGGGDRDGDGRAGADVGAGPEREPAPLEWAEQARLHAERLVADPSLGADGRAEAVTAAAQSHNTLGVALARLGRLEEAVGHIERSVALTRENGLLQAACRGLANLSVLYSTLDPARAIETCLAGLETAKKIGDLGFQSRLYANLAVAYCALTNRCDEQGVGVAHAAIDLDRRLGQLDHLAVPLMMLGQIYQCHGDPTRTIAHHQEALGTRRGGRRAAAAV